MSNTSPKAPKRITSRKQSYRHPFLQGKPKHVWIPEAVGIVCNYPPTLEAYQEMQRKGRELALRLHAEGKFTRKGVPDGWANDKKGIAKERSQATEDAKEIVRIMVKKGLVPDDEAAVEALDYAVSVVRDKTIDVRNKLSAAKLVLDFTKQKPVQNANVTVTAESFLEELAKEK